MSAQLADARRTLDRDERPLGWKLGFGTEAAMQKLGIDAPLVGYLPAANRLESGAVVDISSWGNPKLEPEIVARAGELRLHAPGDALVPHGAAPCHATSPARSRTTARTRSCGRSSI